MSNKKFEEEGSGDLEIKVTSLESQASEELPIEYLIKLKKIAYFIAIVGLNRKDSLKIVDISEDEFLKIIENYPIFGKVVEIKELQYKKDLILTLSKKARDGDDKLALDILTARYPKEFGKGRRSNENEDNTLSDAIEFIQQTGDSSPLIKEESGYGGDQEEKDEITLKIEKFLK